MFEFNNFSLNFDDNIIVEIPNLKLIESGHIVICGEIGSGKSSIAKSLIGYNEFNGEIIYKNNKIEFSKINPEINYVPQNLEYYFLMNSVIDEVMFSSGLSVYEIEKLLHKYGLIEQKNRNPQVLSGGEKVRLVALLCEVNHSRVLILDETVSMNDYHNLQLITKEITNFIKNNILVVEISHEFNRLELADQIIFVSNKKVFEYDSFENFINENYQYLESCGVCND